MSEFQVGELVVVSDRDYPYRGSQATVVVATPDFGRNVMVKDAGGLYHIVRETTLTRVPRRHTIGGVVFEETDVERHLNPGEWGLPLAADGELLQVTYFPNGWVAPRLPVRPVALETKEEQP